MVRTELEQQEMVLLNADVQRVEGGPATWVRPGTARTQQSALDLWLVCPDLAPKVDKLGTLRCSWIPSRS